MALDIDWVRSQFPALANPAVYFDSPGGSQISRPALDRMNTYLLETNSNRGGSFAVSRASDATIDAARAAAADFLDAGSPSEIVFGGNMTSLTLHISRSIAAVLEPGDEIIVTRLDHDANISPWLHAAEASEATVRWVDFDVETGRLDLAGYQSALSDRTKLVAVGLASNALGTVNPVQEIAAAAHEVGAWVYVDAVQAAPHIPISVRQLQADFLVFSVYKVFGPHVSVLYGREPILKDLPPFKVRPASNKPPGKFETGTQNHEGIAGFLGVMEYLEGLAEEQEADADRRSRLKSAMTAIQGYESGLITALQSTLAEVDGLHMYGPMDADPPFDRVPTFSFHPARGQPRAVATELAQRDVYVWNGNFYAQAVTERLGLENRGGLVRIGLVHYNTHDEIGRLADALPDSLQAAATSN